MRYTRILLTAAAVALVACAQRQVEVETGDVVLDSRWIATLAPVAAVRDSAAITGPTTVTLGGRSSMMRGSSSVETRAMLSLFGAAPGSTHAWHIHLGSCGNDRGVIGSPELYTPVVVGNDGRGDITITLPFTTPNTGEFYVDVHDSQTSASRIVACAPLITGGT
jgi:hypothetical protein